MTNEEPKDEAWKKFLRRHWDMALLMIVGIAIAAIAGLFVFLWVVANAQATGLVPAALGQWTVGIFIIFILNVIFWELVFVGIWAIPAALIIYFQWYKKLPKKEQQEYEGAKRKKSKTEDSGFSFFVFLIWLVIVWLGGMWNLALQEWTINNWIFTWLTAILWALLIVGIPGIIYVIWSLKQK
jgi:cation transport ATPase